MTVNSTFTSESVSEGHPDKMADQISDAVLDAIIAEDKNARVACETMVKTGMVVVAGEITTDAWIDLEELCREVILDIGYDSSDVGFDGASCAILNAIGKQSPDIAMGVDEGPDQPRCGADFGALYGLVQVHVREHQGRVLAAELQAELLERGYAGGCQKLAHRRGAGEGHHVDSGVKTDRLARAGTGAGHDVQNATRDPGLHRQLGNTERRQRCLFCRLDHH